VDGAVQLVYDIPAIQVEYVRHEEPVLNTGFWRGVGVTHNNFVVESFIDEALTESHRRVGDPVFGDSFQIRSHIVNVAKKETAMSTTSPRTLLARGMLAATVGVTLFAGTLRGQDSTVSQTAPSARTRSNDIRLPYRLRVLELDSVGAYKTSGALNGEIHGRATVRLWFENKPSGQSGTLPVHTHWAVQADHKADSFEADLHGTFEPASGKTHLVGTITSGPLRGQRVETESRFLNFGPFGTTSDVDGAMTIARRTPPQR
jgi:hypothetical protein